MELQRRALGHTPESLPQIWEWERWKGITTFLQTHHLAGLLQPGLSRLELRLKRKGSAPFSSYAGAGLPSKHLEDTIPFQHPHGLLQERPIIHCPIGSGDAPKGQRADMICPGKPRALKGQMVDSTA